MRGNTKATGEMDTLNYCERRKRFMCIKNLGQNLLPCNKLVANFPIGLNAKRTKRKNEKKRRENIRKENTNKAKRKLKQDNVNEM